MPVNSPLAVFLRARTTGVALALLSLGVGCTSKPADPAPAPITPPTCDVSNETITYAGVIAPIFAANCGRCHATAVAAALGGGTNLGSYAAVSGYLPAALLGSVKHTAGYDPMPKSAPKIPACDIARLEAWYAKGTPQ